MNLLTIEQTAYVLGGLGRSTIYRMISNSQLTITNPGRRPVLIDLAEIKGLVAEARRTGRIELGPKKLNLPDQTARPAPWEDWSLLPPDQDLELLPDV